MSKDFLTDAEMNQGTTQNVPDFIPNNQADKFFGVQQNPEVQDTFLSAHPILKGISDLVGTTGLAKGIAQGIFLKYTDEGKNLLDQVAQGKLTQADVENVIGKTATTKEILGSVVQTGVTLGTAGLGEATAKTALGRVAQVGSKLGGLSAISGGAQAYGEGKAPSEIATEAGISGAVGATFGGIGQSIAELNKMITSSKIAEDLYNRAIGTPKKVIEKGKSPAKFLMNEGISGTQTGILAKSQQIADTSEKDISGIVKNIAKPFKSDDVSRQIKNSLMKKFGNALTSPQVDSIVESLPLNPLKTNNFITARQLNSLRSVIDNRFLGNAKWLNESTVEKTAGLKTAANIMRGLIQSADERLPALFDRLSNSITAIRSLKSELAKPHILSNLVELSVSGALGGITGGLNAEGLKNSLFAYGLTKAALSAPLRTTAAKVFTKLGSTGPVRQLIGGATRTLTPGISKTVSSLLGTQ